MKPQKAEKLKQDVAGFLATIRTAAVRLEGRTKVAGAVDAKTAKEKEAVGLVTKFAADVLGSVEAMEKGLPALVAALADPTPEPVKK